MAKISPIRNHILFQFEDEYIRSGQAGGAHFKDKTDWGFELGTMDSYDRSSKAPRWGRIIAVGHEVCDEIQPGMRVLIEALMWTNAVEFEGDVYWRTDSDQVLAIDEAA